MIRFLCNICGSEAKAPQEKLTREEPTCPTCQSSVRYRSLMHQLSVSLFGKALPLPDFPSSSSIRGLGTSDWEGFARPLALKLNYRNTFYDAEPRLNLKDPPKALLGSCDFVICSEVLEHVSPPIQPAFDGICALLRPGGVALVTVPYTIDQPTVEHFPNLNIWTVIEFNGNENLLVNRTRAGNYEVFDDLKFHGGRGTTLEMRIFCRDDLMTHLSRAGLNATVVDEPFPAFGIFWPVPWSLPLLARKSNRVPN